MSLTRKQIDHVLWLAEQQKQAADAAWNAAIEEAAQNCDSADAIFDKGTCLFFADLCRALKREAK